MRIVNNEFSNCRKAQWLNKMPEFSTENALIFWEGYIESQASIFERAALQECEVSAAYDYTKGLILMVKIKATTAAFFDVITKYRSDIQEKATAFFEENVDVFCTAAPPKVPSLSELRQTRLDRDALKDAQETLAKRHAVIDRLRKKLRKTKKRYQEISAAAYSFFSRAGLVFFLDWEFTLQVIKNGDFDDRISFFTNSKMECSGEGDNWANKEGLRKCAHSLAKQIWRSAYFGGLPDFHAIDNSCFFELRNHLKELQKCNP